MWFQALNEKLKLVHAALKKKDDRHKSNRMVLKFREDRLKQYEKADREKRAFTGPGHDVVVVSYCSILTCKLIEILFMLVYFSVVAAAVRGAGVTAGD